MVSSNRLHPLLLFVSTILLLAALARASSDQSFVNRLNYGVYYKAKFGVKLVTNKWTHVVKLELPVVNETAYANL